MRMTQGGRGRAALHRHSVHVDSAPRRARLCVRISTGSHHSHSAGESAGPAGPELLVPLVSFQSEELVHSGSGGRVRPAVLVPLKVSHDSFPPEP